MAVCVASAPAPTRASLDKAAGLCCRCHSRKAAPHRVRCEICLEKDRARHEKPQLADADLDDGTILLQLTIAAVKREGIDLLPELVALARERGIAL